MSQERVDMKKITFLSIGLAIALMLIGAIFVYIKFNSFVDEDLGTISIEYWTYLDPARNELEAELIQEFERKNPEVKVNMIIYSSAELIHILPNALSAGRGPDVFNIQQDYISSILEKGYINAINCEALGYSSFLEVQDDYIEGALSGVMKYGVVYGIPMEFTNWCLYINKEKFREAGLDPETDYPKSWEDVVEISEKLVVREDGILVERGFDFRYPQYLTFFVPMVQQLGGSIYNADGNLELTNEEAWIKAFTFMQEWGPLHKNLGSPTYINARKSFLNDEAAMMLSGLYHIQWMEFLYPELYEKDDWMIVPFPVFEGGKEVAAAKYCHYWCVNRESSDEKKDGAWSFIGYLSDNAESYLTRAYKVSPQKSIVENLESYGIPYSSVFIEELDNSEFVYSGPSAIEIKNTIETLIKEVMLLGLDPEKAVIRLEIAINGLSNQ